MKAKLVLLVLMLCSLSLTINEVLAQGTWIFEVSGGSWEQNAHNAWKTTPGTIEGESWISWYCDYFREAGYKFQQWRTGDVWLWGDHTFLTYDMILGQSVTFTVEEGGNVAYAKYLWEQQFQGAIPTRHYRASVFLKRVGESETTIYTGSWLSSDIYTGEILVPTCIEQYGTYTRVTLNVYAQKKDGSLASLVHQYESLGYLAYQPRLKQRIVATFYSGGGYNAYIQGTKTGESMTRLKMYSLTISTTTGGTTNPAPGTYYYPPDTVKVTVTAIPNSGYVFIYWMLDGTTKLLDNPTSVYLTASNPDRTLVAYFSNQVILKIRSGGGGTTDPPPADYTYTLGTSVTVRAKPESGCKFDYWTLDGQTKYDNPITVTLTKYETLLTAYFSLTGVPRGGGGCPRVYLKHNPGSTWTYIGDPNIASYNDADVTYRGSFLIHSSSLQLRIQEPYYFPATQTILKSIKLYAYYLGGSKEELSFTAQFNEKPLTLPTTLNNGDQILLDASLPRPNPDYIEIELLGNSVLSGALKGFIGCPKYCLWIIEVSPLVYTLTTSPLFWLIGIFAIIALIYRYRQKFSRLI